MNTTKILAFAAMMALGGLAGCCCYHHHGDAAGHGACAEKCEHKGGDKCDGKCEHHGAEKCGHCAGGHQSVTLNDVPAAVRATFEREAAGGKIEDVERITKGGKTVYSGEVTSNGVEYDMTVAENGMVISKEN